ncbi:MAG: YidH family protein [Ktedonobacterales bacterium]
MSEPMSAGQATETPLDTLRDHLANERTMLAWSRTSIAIVGLGFVVARFALGGKSVTPLSTAFGVALVVLGGGLLALAFRYYMRTGEAIERRDFRWSPQFAVALAAVLELCAVIVCVYLILAA